ncbi:hypothetical protein QJQ45_011372 [Haematococcus lacustris]|nr:hypothetical protein QJQ45_011372 [Haematococcus lacustris]
MHRAPKVKKLRARAASACEKTAQDPKAADQGDDNQGPPAAGVKRLGGSIKAPALAPSKAIAPKAVGTKLKCKRSRVSPTGHAAWLNSYPKVSRWAAQYNLQQLLNQVGFLKPTRPWHRLSPSPPQPHTTALHHIMA